MKRLMFVLLAVFGTILLLTLFVTPAPAQTNQPPISPQSQTCISCHSNVTPGLVADWQASQHSKITVGDALKLTGNARLVSSDNVPDAMKGYAVGCAECHTLNASAHKDNFNHMGTQVNVIVTPNDCKTCHAVEVAQYAGSKKANAHGNIQKNAVYAALVDTLTGGKQVKDGKLTTLPATDAAKAETCLACHGTDVTVKGMKKVVTKMGEFEFPDLVGWPNQGVGRINPDGSMGACTPCHPRHAFSIETARKAYACAECHLKPDVPSWDVYKASKHGNIVLANESAINWSNVPWQVGKDFTAPTCATCHNSLIVDTQGQVVVQRTHDFGARLWVRLFGLIYTAPQPKNGDTAILKNKDGLPLPTAFTGEIATEGLIDKTEQDARKTNLSKLCTSCHSTTWVNARFAAIDTTNAETDKMTLAATQLMLKAWNGGMADNKNPFDEAIEQKWIKEWLFYGNSVRYGTAMGGYDYAAFDNGWWELNNNLQEMQDWIDLHAKK